MKYSNARKRLFTRQFWKTVETKYYLLFLLAVFFTFTTIGFSTDIFNQFEFSYKTLIYTLISTGLIAVGYTYAATKHWWFFPIMIVIQLLYFMFFRIPEKIELTDAVLHEKTIIVGVGIMLSVILGYSFFILFITKVGINHFVMKAEMDLAKEIHDVLVPEIKLKTDKLDIYGKSIPTSEVGGDLIDLVENRNGLYCAIADVSGHGVSSGVYTGMFKSSLRTILSTKNNLDEIVTEVNESLVPLTKRNMFITTSILKLHSSNKAEYIVAGHLPLLHFSKKSNDISEHLTKQIPIGVKTGFSFKSDFVEFESGDIFVMTTDGITETSDKKGNEFGIEKVKQIIKSNYECTAQEISNKLFTEVNKHGNQKDDITLLIIKC